MSLPFPLPHPIVCSLPCGTLLLTTTLTTLTYLKKEQFPSKQLTSMPVFSLSRYICCDCFSCYVFFISSTSSSFMSMHIIFVFTVTVHSCLLVISNTQAAKGGSESSVSDALTDKLWKILRRYPVRPCKKSKLCLRGYTVT